MLWNFTASSAEGPLANTLLTASAISSSPARMHADDLEVERLHRADNFQHKIDTIPHVLRTHGVPVDRLARDSLQPPIQSKAGQIEHPLRFQHSRQRVAGAAFPRSRSMARANAPSQKRMGGSTSRSACAHRAANDPVRRCAQLLRALSGAVYDSGSAL